MDNDPGIHLTFPWSQIITGVVVTALGIFTWFARSVGKHHLDAVATLQTDVKDMQKMMQTMLIEQAVIKAHLRMTPHNRIEHQD